MALWQWILRLWSQLSNQPSVLSRNSVNTSGTLLTNQETVTPKKLSLGESLRKKIYCTENCDLHDILREKIKIDWPEWQLKIDDSHKTIEISERFQRNLKNLNASSNIQYLIRIIDDTFLQYLPDEKVWNSVREMFQRALEENSPELVVKAYTSEQSFTRCLNIHLAANSHHFLKLFCTIQNCPILSRTQDYTEAFSTILTHPKLDRYGIKNTTLYRGAVRPDGKILDSYQLGATILTTSLISTSVDRNVALIFCDSPYDDSFPILWIYTIHGTHRRSALSVETLAKHPDEREVIILRYVPFKVTSVIKEDGRRTDIYLTECSESATEFNRSTTIIDTGVPLSDCQNELELCDFVNVY